MDIQIERTMSSAALEALHETLAVAYPESFEGLSMRKGYVFVHVSAATTEEQDAIVSAVLSHDPTSRSTRQQKEAAAKQRAADAESSVREVPGWATWSETEAVTWIQNNVTDLASAKTALIALTRMVVALRDAQWPSLADE